MYSSGKYFKAQRLFSLNRLEIYGSILNKNFTTEELSNNKLAKQKEHKWYTISSTVYVSFRFVKAHILFSKICTNISSFTNRLDRYRDIWILTFFKEKER